MITDLRFYPEGGGRVLLCQLIQSTSYAQTDAWWITQYDTAIYDVAQLFFCTCVVNRKCGLTFLTGW
jgi:hypothetical protein